MLVVPVLVLVLPVLVLVLPVLVLVVPVLVLVVPVLVLVLPVVVLVVPVVVLVLLVLVLLPVPVLAFCLSANQTIIPLLFLRSFLSYYVISPQNQVSLVVNVRCVDVFSA